MKRYMTILLAACLLAGARGCACAEPAPLRVLAGNEATAQAYRDTYPERELTVIAVDYEQGYRGNLAELLAGGDWDVAVIGTTEFDLATLTENGLATDLSTFPEIAVQAENLYPGIRTASSVGDRLMAFPVDGPAGLVMALQLTAGGAPSAAAYQQRADAHIQALGFTVADQPRTFAELCALGERYMQISPQVRTGTAFITLEGNPTEYMLHYLLDLYTAQYLDTGLCPGFDTEVFRTALAQLEALRAALETDPKNRYDADGFGCLLMADCSQQLISDGVFLQLGDSQSIPAWMGMAVINPKSEHMQEAVDYILLTDSQYACGNAPLLYQKIDYDALVRQSYNEDIAAQIAQHEDQSVIDRLVALRDAGDPSGYYSKEAISHYAAQVAPRLVFPQTRYFDPQSAIQQYMLGTLDADGFIAALNKALAQ